MAAVDPLQRAEVQLLDPRFLYTGAQQIHHQVGMCIQALVAGVVLHEPSIAGTRGADQRCETDRTRIMGDVHWPIPRQPVTLRR